MTARPLVDLWRAMRVLVLPALAILLVGTLSAGLAVAVATWLVVAAILGRALIRIEERRGAKVLAEAGRSSVFIAGLCLVAGSTALFLIFKSSFVDAWDAWSQLLVWGAFVAWGVAFGLRLVAFTRSWVRVALAVGVVALGIRYFFGLFVTGDGSSLGPVDHVVWGCLLVALLAITAFGEDGQVVEPGRATAWRRGLAASLVAALAFVAASVTGMLSDPPSRRVKLAGFREVPVSSSPAAADADVSARIDRPMALARRFAPVLEFTDEERWRPTRVTEFLRHADLQLRDGTRIKAAPLQEQDLPRGCPRGARAPCYQLTIDCPLPRSQETDCEHGATGPNAFQEGATAYVRVLGLDRLRADEQRRGFAVPAFHDDLALVVQYWLFYYYDDWRARTLFGWMRQSHEGDWEAVTLGFSRTRPLFVGLSEHCGGTWEHWSAARVAELPGDPLHPVVGVAQGSQANYRDARANTPPDNWARCSNFRVPKASAMSFAYNIRDRTGIGSAMKVTDLVPVDGHDAVTAFPGLWGMNAEASFETEFGRRYALSHDPRGPASPPLQPLWRDPIGMIFCEPRKTWRQVGDGRRPPRCPRRSKLATPVPGPGSKPLASTPER